ncbi:MAG: hypothetical protein GTN68_24365, partial [Candidatus Aminicenantes bacterium]|nr:hypothetical protein [Candidatus Aminicenantes bacterium]NIO83693.1 hypothetical protein [Candidatus Aminicenantes bacterium]NIQ69622.1 hypothetical protein [Candidatus Aminicenantes bacterium]
WHYSYTLTVPVHGISHIIIEASSGDPWEEFTGLNLFSSLTEPSDWILDTTIQLHTAGGGANPNMPEDMYGIKFDAAFDTTTITVSFDSDRVPVWGDFYSKDGVSSGVDNSLYNAGFINPDPDPTTYPPHDGPEQYHLLVPDTYIPAPGALMLAGIGAGFV